MHWSSQNTTSLWVRPPCLATFLPYRLPPAATVWHLFRACASGSCSTVTWLEVRVECRNSRVDVGRVVEGMYLKQTQSPYPSSLSVSLRLVDQTNLTCHQTFKPRGADRRKEIGREGGERGELKTALAAQACCCILLPPKQISVSCSVNVPI